MYPPATVAKALALVRAGWTYSQISRTLGINRATIRAWKATDGAPSRREPDHCPVCGVAYTEIPPTAYSYLLGQYLGDGMLSLHRGGVYRLRLSCATAWPGVMEECISAIRAVRPKNAVTVQPHPTSNVAEVSSYSKHWICFFPQHGPGAKCRRHIALESWQEAIVLSETGWFLRGLIHSDGCRIINTVNGKRYPRYFFTNYSPDIMRLATVALDRLAIDWRYSSPHCISVARRRSVSLLDQIVGPKY